MKNIINHSDILKHVNSFGNYSTDIIHTLSNNDKWNVYTVTKYHGRPDMIANDIYGDSGYAGFLMFVNNKRSEDFKIGDKIRYISISNLEKIIDK